MRQDLENCGKAALQALQQACNVRWVLAQDLGEKEWVMM